MPPTFVYPGQNLNVSTGPTQSYFMPNFNPIMYGMYNNGGRKTDI
jgi:hypothetical protein